MQSGFKASPRVAMGARRRRRRDSHACVSPSSACKLDQVLASAGLLALCMECWRQQGYPKGSQGGSNQWWLSGREQLLGSVLCGTVPPSHAVRKLLRSFYEGPHTAESTHSVATQWVASPQ